MFGVDNSYPGYAYPGGYQQSRYGQSVNPQAQNVQQGMYAIPQNVSQQTAQFLKGRPVSSFDEAKASMIDMDGSLFVFTDIANKMIYTKQLTLNGTAELKAYRLVEEESTEQKSVKLEKADAEIVTREEFEKALRGIDRRIKNIESVGDVYESGNENNDK